MTFDVLPKIADAKAILDPRIPMGLWSLFGVGFFILLYRHSMSLTNLLKTYEFTEAVTISVLLSAFAYVVVAAIYFFLLTTVAHYGGDASKGLSALFFHSFFSITFFSFLYAFTFWTNPYALPVLISGVFTGRVIVSATWDMLQKQ